MLPGPVLLIWARGLFGQHLHLRMRCLIFRSKALSNHLLTPKLALLSNPDQCTLPEDSSVTLTWLSLPVLVLGHSGVNGLLLISRGELHFPERLQCIFQIRSSSSTADKRFATHPHMTGRHPPQPLGRRAALPTRVPPPAGRGAGPTVEPSGRGLRRGGPSGRGGERTELRKPASRGPTAISPGPSPRPTSGAERPGRRRCRPARRSQWRVAGRAARRRAALCNAPGREGNRHPGGGSAHSASVAAGARPGSPARSPRSRPSCRA